MSTRMRELGSVYRCCVMEPCPVLLLVGAAALVVPCCCGPAAREPASAPAPPRGLEGSRATPPGECALPATMLRAVGGGGGWTAAWETGLRVAAALPTHHAPLPKNPHTPPKKTKSAPCVRLSPPTPTRALATQQPYAGPTLLRCRCHEQTKAGRHTRGRGRGSPMARVRVRPQPRGTASRPARWTPPEPRGTASRGPWQIPQLRLRAVRVRGERLPC